MQENKKDAKTFKDIIRNSLKDLGPGIFHPDKETNEIYDGLNGIFTESEYFKSEILIEKGNSFLQIGIKTKKQSLFQIRIYASPYSLIICIIEINPLLINLEKYQEKFYTNNLFLDVNPFENILIDYLEILAIMIFGIKKPSISKGPLMKNDQ